MLGSLLVFLLVFTVCKIQYKFIFVVTLTKKIWGY